MVKVLPPYQVITPEYKPGQKISVAPIAHYLWLEDYEYYDQLGRDPMQERKIWLIQDEEERMSKFLDLVKEYPKQRHRRQMLVTAVRRGNERFVQHLVRTGLVIHPDIAEAKTQQEEYDQAQLADDFEPPEDLPDIADPTVTPLHSAAHNGQLGCLKIMMEEGQVDVDARDEFNRTPLHAAAANGQTNVVRYLLGKDANPTKRTDSEGGLVRKHLGLYAGANAFEMATGEGNVEILRMILDHVSGESHQDSGESGVSITPLAIKLVAYGRNVDALRFLLEGGGYPMEPKGAKTKAELLNETQQKAIDEAIPLALYSSDYATLHLLLSYRYPLSPTGAILPFDVPPNLHRPFVYGAYDAVMHNDLPKFTFIHGFNIAQHSTMSPSPLPPGQHLNIQHLFEDAAETSSISCMKYLIAQHGAQPDAHRIPSGVKPLYLASALNQHEAVKFLLEECKVDIHAASGRFATGPTALRIAVWLQALDCVKILLEHGGPVDYIGDKILHLTPDQTTKAILRCVYEDDRPKVFLETEDAAKEYIQAAKYDLEDRMPRYVRVEFEPEDQGLIDGIQLRRRAEKLREYGAGAREFSLDEAVRDEALEEGDVRKMMVPVPTYLDRESIVKADVDLVPEFKPFAVAA